MTWDHPLTSRANSSNWTCLGYQVPVSHRFNVNNRCYAKLKLKGKTIESRVSLTTITTQPLPHEVTISRLHTHPLSYPSPDQRHTTNWEAGVLGSISSLKNPQRSRPPEAPVPTLVCQQLTRMEGTQKPTNFTTPRGSCWIWDIITSGAQAERTAGGLTVLMPMSLEDTQETGGPEKEWIGMLARHFLRLRGGDNILVESDTLSCIWLATGHAHSQER